MHDQKIIIIYDGDCGLCSETLQWILVKDKKDVFRYTTMNSSVALQLLKQFNLSQNLLNSIIVINRQNYYLKSNAIIVLLLNLDWKYQILAFVIKLIPQFISNALYDFIAKHRRNLLKQNCSIQLLYSLRNKEITQYEPKS